MDPRDRLTALQQKLHESGWAAGTDVYADGFTDFTPQELAVLKELIMQ
jgi:ATP-dependent helicase/nuclease subunit B